MKDTVIRALRTFFQAAIGYVAANLAVSVSGICDGSESLKNVLVTLFAAAVAFGLSAVMNLPKKSAGNGGVGESEKENVPFSGEGVSAVEKNVSDNGEGASDVAKNVSDNGEGAFDITKTAAGDGVSDITKNAAGGEEAEVTQDVD